MLVRPTGPSPNELMLVSDYPGREEHTTGRALSGRVGKEVNRYLDGIELPHRDEVRVAKLIMHWNEDNEYTMADVEQDAAEFEAELQHTDPRTIVTLGRWSARHFLGDVDLDEVHAIPWEIDGGRVVLPIYNPAAGFRSPEIQSSVAYGFRSLKEYLSGELRPRRLFDDAYPNPVYLEVPDAKWLRAALSDVEKVWIDTEGHPRRVWSLQFTIHPGSGYLIRASSLDQMNVFKRFLAGDFNGGRRPKVVFHGSLHDLSIFPALGIEVNDLDFDDTQVMAYLLQLEPRGLKPNCVRHCGMRMQSFDDIMGDVSNELAIGYAQALYEVEQFDYDERQQAEFELINQTPLLDKEGNPKRDKAGNIKYRKTRVLPNVPKTRLHRATERILRSKNPRKLWEDQVEDVRVDAYNRLGEMPEATLDHVSFESALNYACRDSDGTCRLEPELSRRVDAAGLRRVYNLEIGTYPLIARMHKVGIKPDLATFATLSDALRVHIGELQEKIERLTGRQGFNANSGDQVADYLFGQLALPPYKMTSEGRPSTNDKILEALEREFGGQHPVISDFRSYRETFKLKHTFVDRIPDFVNRYPYDGRIHSTFRTTTVVTGRLSASDPNILALPKHGYFAPIFQLGFVAEDGHLIGTWDQSQIELRVLAHLSQDPYMLAVFRGEIRRADGKLVDLHAALAERIFGVKPELQDDSLHRLPAKAINFGIPMGMTADGLMVELRKNGVMVSRDDTQRWLDETLKLYKGVKQYQLNKIAEARRFGFVTCMSGRRRYIGGIRSWDEYTRAEAERFAFSTPIQEGAQTVMKTAEYHVWNDVILPLQRDGHWVEPLVQIHDDLKLEFEEGLKDMMNPLMSWAMTETFEGLSVPLKTDGKYGHNWGELSKY